MDSRPTHRVAGREGGFATLQYVATVGLSLVLLVLVANVLVDLYARGVVRDALDEGVRAGAVVGASSADCERRAAEVLDGLLRGPVGQDVNLHCGRRDAVVTASAEVTLPSWLPMLVPPWKLELDAEMQGEQ